MSARRLAVAVALVASSLGAGCSRLVASSDDDGPWLIHETPHFTFHYRPGSLAEAAMPQIAAEAEAGRAEICSRLAVAFDGVVTYYLYPPDEAADIGVIAGGGSPTRTSSPSGRPAGAPSATTSWCT